MDKIAETKEAERRLLALSAADRPPEMSEQDMLLVARCVQDPCEPVKAYRALYPEQVDVSDGDIRLIVSGIFAQPHVQAFLEKYREKMAKNFLHTPASLADMSAEAFAMARNQGNPKAMLDAVRTLINTMEMTATTAKLTEQQSLINTKAADSEETWTKKAQQVQVERKVYNAES